MVDENMALNRASTDESNNNIFHEETPLKLDENSEVNQNELSQETSNGLENFDLIEETPELFNSNNEVENETTEEDKNTNIELEEDELEIPAFLRRQKN